MKFFRARAKAQADDAATTEAVRRGVAVTPHGWVSRADGATTVAWTSYNPEPVAAWIRVMDQGIVLAAIGSPETMVFPIEQICSVEPEGPSMKIDIGDPVKYWDTLDYENGPLGVTETIYLDVPRNSVLRHYLVALDPLERDDPDDEDDEDDEMLVGP